MFESSTLGASSVALGVDPKGLDRLSPQEDRVLALASTGLLDKQIAVELGVSTNTLRTYWGRIRSKIGEVPRSALTVAYAERRASQGAIEGASWHIDLLRRVLVYYGERDLFPQGETDLDEVIERHHPDDIPRIRALFRDIERPDMPAFSFVARIITDHGVELTSAYVEIVRDAEERTVRVVGRNVPVMNFLSPLPGNVFVGSYERDLVTNMITVDEGFCEIFRVRKDDPNLRETIISRYCSDYRERTRHIVDEMIRAGRQRLRRSYRLCFEDGTQLWASTDMRMTYEDGRPIRFNSTVTAYE